MFIDDVHPEASLRAQKLVEEKFEVIARTIGDGGIIPARVINGSECTRYSYSLAVIAGEIYPSNNQSAVARSIIISLKASDFDAKALKFCRKNKKTYNTFIYNYIIYISGDDGYAKRLYESFSKYQDELCDSYPGAHPRTISSIAWLLAVYDELVKFLSLHYEFGDQQLEAIGKEYGRYLDGIGKKSALVNQQLDEVSLFLQAVLQLEKTKTVAIMTIKNGVIYGDATKAPIVGYRDNTYIYLSASAFDHVTAYFKTAGRSFLFAPEQIRERLNELGILVKLDADKTKLTSRLTVAKNRQRYTVLSQQNVLNFMNKGDDDNE